MNLDPKQRDKALNVVNEMITHIQNCSFMKPKIYQKICTTCHAVDKNVSFDAVHGEIEIKASLKKTLVQFATCGTIINESSPKQLQKSTVYTSVSFYTKNDEENYLKMMKEENFDDIALAITSGSRSPAPMLVQNRDIYAHGAIRKINNKIYLCFKSFDAPLTKGYVTKGYVRANLINSTVILQEIDTNTTRVEQFQLCDPSGNIPSWVCNSALDARNDILLLLKGFLEGYIKPE
ncbi:Conserved_hypothetical protein [Hexamita inflata]|uniref:START domain-containing protein n=1 Tax=Hexamita inflata TaxID=28002 RepID=A0AA86QAE8_9EUKA|nr:Conserved hypothetical protein [Hexamita inflata]